MIDKELVIKAITQYKMSDAAKQLGMTYAKLLKLRKHYGMLVKLGSNKYNKNVGFRWNRLSPFNAITGAYFNAYKSSAKRRKHNFELTLAEFREFSSKPCFYCGQLECRVTRPSGGLYYRSKVNGIDRIDNNVGYVVENCRSCCSVCNYAKRKMTTSDFIAWIRRIVANKVLQ